MQPTEKSGIGPAESVRALAMLVHLSEGCERKGAIPFVFPLGRLSAERTDGSRDRDRAGRLDL